MTTQKLNPTDAKVACACCKKATAICLIKDGGFKTWPACVACKRECERHPAYRG